MKNLKLFIAALMMCITVQGFAQNLNITFNGPYQVCQGVNTAFNFQVAGPGTVFSYEIWWGDNLVQTYYNDTSAMSVDPTHTYFGSGTHYLDVTVWNDVGDTMTNTITIIVLDQPIVDVGMDQSICQGGSIGLFGNGSGGGPSAYTWSPGSSLDNIAIMNPTATPTVNTIYTLIFTDMNGCQNSDSVLVTVNTNPTVNLSTTGSTTFCQGDSTVVLIDVIALTGVVAYSWNPSTVSPTSAITSSGIYTLTVSDANGCIGTSSPLTVTVLPATTADYPTSINVCGPGNPVQINPITVDNSYSYVWNIGNELDNLYVPNPTAIVNDTTTFYVTISNGTCTFHDSVTLILCFPPLFTLADTHLCDTTTYFTWIPGYASYLWNTPSGFYTTQGVILSQPGQYELTVTDANGCASSDDFMVITGTLSDVIPDTNPTSFCEHTYINIEGSAGYSSYSWSNGYTTPNIFVITAGTYYLTVSNLGCTGSDSITITMLLAPTAVITPNGPTSICMGDSVSLSMQAGYSQYLWSIPLDTVIYSGQQIYANNSGTYYGGVVGSNGCIGADSIDISYANCGYVWPGDVDLDLVVSHFDLFFVGYNYNATLPARPTQSIVWAAQDPGAASGNSLMHSDCNGDGTINSQDSLAIIQNFGLTHNKTEEIEVFPNAALLRLINPYTSNLIAGQHISLPVELGDAANVAENLYAIAFTVNYNPEYIDSASIGFHFSEAFMGQNGVEQISIRKRMHSNGQLHLAATRINQTGISNFGTIGDLYCITVENLPGKSEELIAVPLEFSISNVVVLNASHDTIPINTQGTSVDVDYTTSITDVAIPEVGVYPNPFSESVSLRIVSSLATEGSIEISNVLGTVIYSQKLDMTHSRNQTISVNTTGFAKGVYMASVKVGNGVKMVKVVKQ